MANKIKFGSHIFDVPGDGVWFSDSGLGITFILDEDLTVDDIEKLIDGSTETVNLLDDKGDFVVATYKGYSKFRSIQKVKDYAKEDGTKGTAIRIELYTPSLRDTVAQNAADISAINEAIADLASSISADESEENSDDKVVSKTNQNETYDVG